MLPPAVDFALQPVWLVISATDAQIGFMKAMNVLPT